MASGTGNIHEVDPNFKNTGNGFNHQNDRTIHLQVLPTHAANKIKASPLLTNPWQAIVALTGVSFYLSFPRPYIGGS